MYNRSLLLAVAGVGILSTASAQQVMVRDGNAPVPYARVAIVPLQQGMKGVTLLADAKGNAGIPAEFEGFRCVVKAQAMGFEPEADTLIVKKTGIHAIALKHRSNDIREVVVTGQYGENTADKALQKINVISRKTIDQMAAQNLRDVLTNQLNVRLEQDAVLGSSMSLQGISGQNVKILVDGVPVVGRLSGNIDISQINLNNVERIEIVEGPMAVSYGTDALGGAINLITRKSQQQKIETGLTTYYETVGNYNVNARLGFSKGKHTLLLSGGRNFFDGWTPGEKISFDFSAQPADARRAAAWKPKEQYFGELKYLYRIKDLTLSYKGNIFDEVISNRGLPEAPYQEWATDDYYHTRRIDNAVFLTGNIKPGHNLNIQLAYNDFRRIKNTYTKDLTTLEQSLSQQDGAQDTTAFRVISSRGTYSTGLDRKINFEAGYDANIEYAQGERIEGDSKHIGDYAVFASAEYKPVKNVGIRPGLRVAYNTQYNAPLIPSLNFYFKPIDQVVVRASYARGFRAPTLKELYFYFYDSNHKIKGNRDLQAEYSNNYTVSAQYAAKAGELRFKVEAAGFYNDISNLITLAVSNPAIMEYSYQNIGNYKTLGLQLNTEWQYRQFKAGLGGSYIGRLSNIPEAGFEQFAYAPEVRASMQYEVRKWDFSAAVFYKYTGRLPGFGLNAANEVMNTWIDAYNTADVTLIKQFFQRRFAVSAGVKNLFDVQNVNMTTGAAGTAHATSSTSSMIGTGRNYFLKLDLNLGWK
jgi:outer membrane receptor for ferrienterochelin and colicins